MRLLSSTEMYPCCLKNHHLVDTLAGSAYQISNIPLGQAHRDERVAGCAGTAIFLGKGQHLAGGTRP